MITECPCCDYDGYEHPQRNENEAILACPNCNPPDGSQKCTAVDRILEERARPIKDRLYVTHLDGDIFNNDPANLRMVTAAKNKGNR